ncbi:MAG: choice-of-anchor B family protein [Calditrichaeota bacterium]|nr:MAG: choice-of-anchor B family protein [Calditrichota bacterium]
MKHGYTALLLWLMASVATAQNTNITLLSQVHMYPGGIPWSYSDIWGYTAPDGREYALLGVTSGTSVVEITDPTQPVERDFVPSLGSGNGLGWRDIKTYQHYMYIVTEATNEMQIVDLSPLPDSVSVVGIYSDFVTHPHNIYIDTEAGILYGFEDFNFNSPVRIISLADPVHPVTLTTITPPLGTDSHDGFAQDSVLYVAEGTNGSIGIFDVSNPANPALLQRLPIPSPGYVHNVWVTEDNRYMITTEETVGKTIKIWDIQNLNQITLVDEYIGENQFAHNAFFRGDFAYISHYGSGVKILDVADPTNVVEVGSYQQYPGGLPPNVWGVYPYTGNGVILSSDMEQGLFVTQFNGTRAYRIVGTVEDALTGAPIESGWVEIVESGRVKRTDADGHFKTGHSGSGAITLRVTGFGYEVQEIPLTAVPGQTDSITVALQPSARNDLTGTVTDAAGQPLAGFELTLTVVSPLFPEPHHLQATTNASGVYQFTDLPVSDSVWVQYTHLEVGKRFPFPATGTNNVSLPPGPPVVIDFQLHPADLLLVNDDQDGNYTDTYTAAIQAAGLRPFIWITGQDGENIPAGSMGLLTHRVMVWYSGDTPANILSTTEQDSLGAFLDQGGALLLTGQDIAQDLSAQGSAFLNTYLQVNYGGNAINAPLIRPVPGNPITGGLSNFVAGQPSRDVIPPLGGGNAGAAFTYTNGAVAGVTVDNPANHSRIVFLGFGMEAISNTAIRENLMAAALNYLTGALGIADPGEEIAGEFELKQNYPNPFNPETTIEYHLPRTATVKVQIYNLLGQEVWRFSAEHQPAGVHRLRWNGRDSRGLPVGSGIYFYRLTVTSANRILFRDMRRMVLLR